MFIAAGVVLILILLAASGFNSACETALTSLSKENQRFLGARHPELVSALAFWHDNPGRVLAFMLVTNNFFNIGLGVVATALAIELARVAAIAPELMLVVLPGAVTIALIVVGEIVPKVVARSRYEQISHATIRMIVFATRHLAGFTNLLVRVADRLIALLGSRGFGTEVFISPRELRTIFSSRACKSASADATRCVVDEHGVEMSLSTDIRALLRNLLSISDTTVGEVMTPRTEMFAVNITDSAERIFQSIGIQGYSRVPVFEKSIDNIVGIIYAKDLLHAWRNRALILVRDLLRPAHFVPSTTRLTELLRQFKTGTFHMAIVVDEFGGTAGLVTNEDALEEIFGEIYDEYDERTVSIKQEQSAAWVVAAQERLAVLNERLHLALPEEEFESLASYLLALFGRLPKQGESIQAHGVRFEVVSADRRRISSVRIHRLS